MATVPSTSIQPGARRHARAIVLLVIDEWQHRHTLTYRFEQAGYQVTTAANAQDALFYLGIWKYDVALLDLHPLNQDSTRLAMEIHEKRPRLPVIIQTEQLLSGSKAELWIDPVTAYVAKGIEPEHVISRIEEALKRA